MTCKILKEEGRPFKAENPNSWVIRSCEHPFSCSYSMWQQKRNFMIVLKEPSVPSPSQFLSKSSSSSGTNISTLKKHTLCSLAHHSGFLRDQNVVNPGIWNLNTEYPNAISWTQNSEQWVNVHKASRLRCGIHHGQSLFNTPRQNFWGGFWGAH